MSLRLASLTAQLIDKPPDDPSDSLAQRINGTIKPPQAVSAEDIHIRAMYLVSDEVNSFGGCFPSDEHPSLIPLLVDVPVMIGHRKDRLPVARTFHATIERRDGHQWVKVLFYWLHDTDGAESLAANIDGGLYKECSIGFVYRFPECSVCGRDMRRCEHEPLRRYTRDGHTVTAHFNYRQVDRVLECSLVYRGAQPNTAMTNDVTLGDWHAPESFTPADTDDLLLLTPAYDGIPVVLSPTDDGAALIACDNSELPADLSDRFALDSTPNSAAPVFGLIVGYRGKQRCSADETRAFLRDRSGPVSRLDLKLLWPDVTCPGRHTPDPTHTVTPLRHRITTHRTLPETAAVLATRDGVRVWRLPHRPPHHPGYSLDPAAHVKPANTYTLHDHDSYQSLELSLTDRTTSLDLLGKPFDPANLAGKIEQIRRRGEAYQVAIDSRLFLLRPVILHGRRRYLCQSLEDADARN